MITPKIQDFGSWVKLSLTGVGTHALDVSEKGERIWRVHLNKDELRELRNCIDYYLNYNYPKPKKIEEWD